MAVFLYDYSVYVVALVSQLLLLTGLRENHFLPVPLQF